MKSEQQILTLCENLRELRKKHGLSKKKMASILKISVSSLNSLENNMIPPLMSSTVLFRVSHHFKIRVCDLFRPMEE